MSSSPISHTYFHVYIAFSTCQFKQVWCWDVDQTLYFTLDKHKSAKASGAQPRTPLGELTAPPQTP